MNEGERKTEAWFTRLSIPTIARIERLMEEFDWKSRDVFLEEALAVLEHVRAGQPLPASIEAARRRRADKLLKDGDAQ